MVFFFVYREKWKYWQSNFPLVIEWPCPSWCLESTYMEIMVGWLVAYLFFSRDGIDGVQALRKIAAIFHVADVKVVIGCLVLKLLVAVVVVVAVEGGCCVLLGDAIGEGDRRGRVWTGVGEWRGRGWRVGGWCDDGCGYGCCGRWGWCRRRPSFFCRWYSRNVRCDVRLHTRCWSSESLDLL